MRVVRLFSADVSLEPVALAPATPETEAVYSPSDSLTLPEYCLPSTVVEKLLAAEISSDALLLLLLLPPPPELECEAVLELVVLAVVVLAVAWVASEAVVEVVDEVAVDLAVDTGFSTVKLDALDIDEIEPISMIFPSDLNQLPSSDSSAGSLRALEMALIFSVRSRARQGEARTPAPLR